QSLYQTRTRPIPQVQGTPGVLGTRGRLPAPQITDDEFRQAAREEVVVPHLQHVVLAAEVRKLGLCLLRLGLLRSVAPEDGFLGDRPFLDEEGKRAAVRLSQLPQLPERWFSVPVL